MDNFLTSVFGPLGKDYCLYFYLLSMVGFFLLALLLVTSLMVGISQRKGIDFYFQMLTIGIGYAILYFQNRLLHSMCVGSA